MPPLRNDSGGGEFLHGLRAQAGAGMRLLGFTKKDGLRPSKMPGLQSVTESAKLSVLLLLWLSRT